MLIAESEWIKKTIQELQLPPGSKVLNFGSQRINLLRYQRYIEQNIYRTVALKQWQLLNFDLYPGEGVDINGDITQDDVFSALKEVCLGAIFAFNVLEHVVDRALICSRIVQLLPKGGYLLASVPFNYPVHNDPIDNRFRPTPDELIHLFPSCILVKSNIVVDKSYLFYLRRNKRVAVKFILRLLTPFYKFANWKTQVALLPYLFKKFQVTVVVLQKC
jgi:SAM-dependent methyltransferase